jgi:phenylacetate-coenzyme A ligase PaaK-like adenylate-forming protein
MDEHTIKQHVIESFFRTLSYERKNSIDTILTETPFVETEETKGDFLLAMKESLLYQQANSPFFKAFCEHKKFSLEDLLSFEDLKKVPFLITDIFKTYSVSTNTNDNALVNFTSSGTSGKKSHIALNAISGSRLLYSTYYIYKNMGLVSEIKTNYLMMTYNPDVEDAMATSNSDVIVSLFAPAHTMFYALDIKNKEMTFLVDEAVEQLRSYVIENIPIRILGFPHHTVEVLKKYTSKYGTCVFPENSYILTGGGWKGFEKLYGKDFDALEFIRNNTNLPLSNLRDVYSFVEHGVDYLDCEHHNKHVPNVSHVYIRNPKTLAILADGEEGLLQFISPVCESYPNMSLLTTDFGYLNHNCPCGRDTAYITITRRASLSKTATCALTADELLLHK